MCGREISSSLFYTASSALECVYPGRHLGVPDARPKKPLEIYLAWRIKAAMVFWNLFHFKTGWLHAPNLPILRNTILNSNMYQIKEHFSPPLSSNFWGVKSPFFGGVFFMVALAHKTSHLLLPKWFKFFKNKFEQYRKIDWYLCYSVSRFRF